MASSYYDSAGKDVSNTDISNETDINDINSAVDTAFQLVESAITAISNDAITYAALAQKWAEELEDVEVTPGNYSSLHHAAKAAASAAAALVSETNAATSESNAATSETNAGISEANAATSEANALVSQLAAEEAALRLQDKYEFVATAAQVSFPFGITYTNISVDVSLNTRELNESDGDYSYTTSGVTLAVGADVGDRVVIRVYARNQLDLFGNIQYSFDTVADMVASTDIIVGQRVTTSGYYSAGDGGGNDYIIVAAATGTPDGGSYIDLTGSSLQAEGVYSGVINVKTFGAKGDNVATDTVSIQAAIDFLGDYGGEVYFPPGDYKCIGIVLSDHITLSGPSHSMTTRHVAGTARAPATLFAASTGIIVDSPVAILYGASISGLGFIGLGAGTSVTGVRLQDALRCTIQFCTFDAISEQAISIVTGNVNTIKENFAQNCLLDRTRGAKSGVVEVGSDDTLMTGGEYTASVTGSITDANAYCGAVLVTGSNGFFNNIQAEISDFGFNVSGSYNRFSDCRADLNMGNGFELIGTNQFSNCTAMRNSQDTNNTYDGFSVTAGRNQFTGCSSYSLSGDANKQRYGFNDTQQSDTNKSYYVNCTGFNNVTQQLNNNTFGASISIPQSSPISITDLDATPSVDGRRSFKISNSVATNVTDFDLGFYGQIIEVLATNSNTTYVHGTNIYLTGGVNYNQPVNTMIRFFKADNAWYQI